MSYISKRKYFSEHILTLYGGWPRYYATTDYIRAHGIIDTFHIFTMLKVARVFNKISGMMLME